MSDLTDAYEAALRGWIRDRTEAALEQASLLGRGALGGGVLDVVSHHDKVLAGLNDAGGSGSACLAAFLSSMEMASRGYVSAVEALQQSNRDLEERVSERTKELRQTERRAWALIEQLPAVPFVQSSSRLGSAQYVSPRVERLLGVPVEDWMRGPSILVERMDPSDRTSFLERVGAWEQGEPGPLEITYRVQGPEDTLVWIHEESVRVEDPVTGAPQILGLLRDVTRQHRLETMVRHAQRLEGIGQLAGGIAHDFNNLLGVILGFTQMAREAPDDPAVVGEALDSILTAAQAAHEITGHLRTFSRRADDRVGRLDVDRTLRDVEKLLRASLGPRVRLELRLGAPGVDVLLTQERLVQIILNLCINARDALGDAGSVVVATQVLDAPEPVTTPTLQLSVSDDGPGIPDEVLERIFEPFFTTKQRGRGTGLGLSTVHGIVEQAGGDLLVHSTVGEGTTFEIRIPTAPPPSEVRPAPSHSEGSPGARLLVVDDDPLFIRLLEAQLGRTCHDVVLVSDPIEAMRHIEGPTPPDLLVTDVVMPGMSGVELGRRARQVLPGLPVLLLSGFVTVGRDLAPPVAFHAKPLGRAELLDAVSSLLGEEVAHATGG